MPTPTPTPTNSPSGSPTPTPLPINTFQFTGDESLKTALTPQLQDAVDKFTTDLNNYLDKKYPLTTNAAGAIVRAIPPGKIVIVNVLWKTFQRLASSPIVRELAKKALNELFDRILDKITEILDADDSGDNGKKCYIGTFENGNLIELNGLARFIAIEFIETEKARRNSIAKSFGNYIGGSAIDQIELGALNFVSDDFLLPEIRIGGLKTLHPVPSIPGKLSISILPRIYTGKYRVYQYLPNDIDDDDCPQFTPSPSNSPSGSPTPTGSPNPTPTPT